MKQNSVCLFLCLLIVMVASFCFWAPHSHAVETSPHPHKNNQSHQGDNSSTHDHSHNEISCCKNLQTVTPKQNISTILQEIYSNLIEQSNFLITNFLSAHTARKKRTSKHYFELILTSTSPKYSSKSNPINAPPVS